MVERQLSVFLENKPGVLAELCRTLAAAGIAIRGLSASDTVDHAVVRMVVDDPVAAAHLLGERGTLVIETPILSLTVPQPDGLARVADELSRASVNIEYAYGNTSGILFLRVSDLEKAQAALRAL
jgi:hypothetical protein